MQIKHIHFVGIKGVGMAPLAIIAREAGAEVTGSDVADAFITDEILAKHTITPFVGFDPQHVQKADLVITTGAHGGYDNVEVREAKKQHIPVMTQGEAVGAFMEGNIFEKTYQGISVSGTHGKTTTSAMVAHLLSFAKLDPSWVVGTSTIPSLGEAGHFGKGTYFVAEADEYANEPTYDKTPKMLLQKPRIAVLTNVEHDHPDVYPTIEDALRSFTTYAKMVESDGMLVACGDDKNIQHILREYHGKVLTYGMSSANDYVISNIKHNEKGSTWDVIHEKEKVQLALQVSGEHNVLNATAAYIVAKLCGVPLATIQKGLLLFSGTKRRMEYIGQSRSGVLIYDDYAHHPTEIESTLKAFRKKYHDKKIVCIFQPHTFSRTKLLLKEFATSLGLADEVILTDIYPSAREAFDSQISSEIVAKRIQNVPVSLARTLSDVVKYITQQGYGKETVLITMGAGDVYSIANNLLGI